MLQRISFNLATLSTMKITDAVDVDTQLTLSTQDDQRGMKYELRTVIIHEGPSIESGKLLSRSKLI